MSAGDGLSSCCGRSAPKWMPLQNAPPPDIPPGNNVETVGPVQNCFLSCCCLRVEDRDTAPDWMLSQPTTGAPSLYVRCCWCMCTPEERHANALEDIPQLRGLAGITVQDGDHNTKGSLETLRYDRYDPASRVLDTSVFGGFYNRAKLGLWTEPTTPLYSSCMWAFLMNLARQANYSYRFEFSEDLRSADI